MPRSFLLLVVLVFPLAAGCRMCGSPYDYCMPGYTDREADYRGCDSKYRAGSIFYTSYSGCSDGELFAADRSMNTGNFGTTVPINVEYRPERIGEKPSTERPGQSPDSSSGGFEGFNTGDVPPNIDDILKGTPVNKLNTPSMPPSVPLNPPSKTPAPRTPSPDSIETIPFTVPPAGQPSVNPPVTGTPEITIEELRKLDPTVTDIKILNIEDSPGAAAPSLIPRR